MAKTKKQPVDPFIASLMPESDKRFAGVALISLVVALSLFGRPCMKPWLTM